LIFYGRFIEDHDVARKITERFLLVVLVIFVSFVPRPSAVSATVTGG
jgi:hypothetical protein